MISGFTHINKVWVSIFNYHVLDIIMKYGQKGNDIGQGELHQ